MFKWCLIYWCSYCHLKAGIVKITKVKSFDKTRNMEHSGTFRNTKKKLRYKEKDKLNKNKEKKKKKSV